MMDCRRFRLVTMSEIALTRTVAESQSERSEIVLPADSNALGNLFGGRLMQYIDLVGAMAASRHARAYTVTASMDHLDFVAPVKVGDMLILKASVNRAFRTSMEVGVRAMVEDVRAQRVRHVSSAYLTFVAMDREGNRLVVPQVVPQTEHQRRRFEDAGRRREMRAGERQRKKEVRALLGEGSVFVIGIIHGLGAETPSQLMIFLLAANLGGATLGMLGLAMFLAGLLTMNALMTASAAGAFGISRHRPHLLRAVSAVTGIYSLAMGLVFLTGRTSLLPVLN